MVMAPSALVPPEEFVTKQYHENHNKHESSLNHHHHGVHELNEAKLAAKDLVFEILKKRVQNIDVDGCHAGEEDAFYVADMGEIYRQHLRWKMNLGRVKPFYGRSRLESLVEYDGITD